jgi:hypothetical protein
MARFSTQVSWFFLWLGCALLTVAMLAVPENALADAGSDCASECAKKWTPGTSDYYVCLAGCCDGKCPLDKDCATTCCDSACVNESNYEACMAGCTNNASWTCFLNCGCSSSYPYCSIIFGTIKCKGCTCYLGFFDYCD